MRIERIGAQPYADYSWLKTAQTIDLMDEFSAVKDIEHPIEARRIADFDPEDFGLDGDVNWHVSAEGAKIIGKMMTDHLS